MLAVAAAATTATAVAADAYDDTVLHVPLPSRRSSSTERDDNSSAGDLAPPAAAFLELGRSVEGFAKLDPNAEDPSEAQSQTVDKPAMVTAWNRRYGDWYKKNNLKDCPNGYTVVQAPCFGNDGLTTVKMAVKGHEISCPGLTTVSCPYDRARPGENQKCVACVRRGQNGRCRVDTRFVPCG